MRIWASKLAPKVKVISHFWLSKFPTNEHNSCHEELGLCNLTSGTSIPNIVVQMGIEELGLQQRCICFLVVCVLYASSRWSVRAKTGTSNWDFFLKKKGPHPHCTHVMVRDREDYLHWFWVLNCNTCAVHPTAATPYNAALLVRVRIMDAGVRRRRSMLTLPSTCCFKKFCSHRLLLWMNVCDAYGPRPNLFLEPTFKWIRLFHIVKKKIVSQCHVNQNSNLCSANRSKQTQFPKRSLNLCS